MWSRSWPSSPTSTSHRTIVATPLHGRARSPPTRACCFHVSANQLLVDSRHVARGTHSRKLIRARSRIGSPAAISVCCLHTSSLSRPAILATSTPAVFMSEPVLRDYQLVRWRQLAEQRLDYIT